MKDEEQQAKRGFKVEDRRRFSDQGDLRPDAQDREEPRTPEPPPAADTARPLAGRSAPPAMDLNFSTFIISLSTQALAHLGEIPNPVDNSVTVDLEAAKQLIDIIGMLRDKTKGNLDANESSLLDNMLYDLRLRYVERARQPS